MLLDGSWAQGFFEDYEFTMSWFPPPVKEAGDRQTLDYHTDNAWAMNKATEHPDEVKEYLTWLATAEQAQLMVNNAVRLMDENLSKENPTGFSLLLEALTSMFDGEFTPEQAAAHVQNGLDLWYVPGN